MGDESYIEYTLLSPEGKRERGRVPKVELENVLALVGKGYTILELQEIDGASAKSVPTRLMRAHKGSPHPTLRFELEEQRIFTLYLAVLLRAGIPILPSLEVLADSDEEGLSAVAEELAKQVATGNMLSDALSRLPDCFDATMVTLVKVGEESGQLDQVLAELASRTERISQARARLKSALFYPSGIVLVAGLMIAFMAFYMLPRFLPILASFNAEPPLPTRILMHFTGAAVPLTILFFVTLASLPWLMSDLPRAKKLRGYLLFELPFLGRLNRYTSLSHLCHDLELMLRSGINLVDALKCLRPPDPKVRALVVASVSRVMEGGNWSEALAEDEIIPPSMAAVASVGEETGRLGEMLLFQAELLEQDAEMARTTFFQMLEPMLLLFLGCIVGFVLLACFLPIYQMASSAL